MTVLGSEVKASQFFGEEVFNSVLDAGDYHFLKVSFNAGDVMYGVNGDLKGATLKVIVDLMTSHSNFDVKFVHSFLLTYRTFCKSVDFANYLTKRFFLQPPKNLNDIEIEIWQEKMLKPVRLRVVSVFKTWLENYFLSKDDLAILSLIKRFVSSFVADVLPSAATKLLKLIEKREKSMSDHTRRLTF